MSFAMVPMPRPPALDYRTLLSPSQLRKQALDALLTRIDSPPKPAACGCQQQSVYERYKHLL